MIPRLYPGQDSMDSLRGFGFLLKDVSRLYTANFQRHAAELNMTLPQCKVLCHLERNEGLSQAQLADVTDTDPMTLVRILDRMESDGLLERRPDPDDRRTRRLYLLPPAHTVLKAIWRVSDRARAESFARMPVADRAQLFGLLQQMRANLEALLPSAETITGRPLKKSPARASARTRQAAKPPSAPLAAAAKH